MRDGGVRERPNRAVLKTVESQGSVGSNPTPAAHMTRLEPAYRKPTLETTYLEEDLMDDHQIHGKIEQLVAEEHELWERESTGNASEADRQRLQELKVRLDQYWDLLRQRRALREAGRDPSAADVRRPEVVEHYEQ